MDPLYRSLSVSDMRLIATWCMQVSTCQLAGPMLLPEIVYRSNSFKLETLHHKRTIHVRSNTPFVRELDSCTASVSHAPRPQQTARLSTWTGYIGHQVTSVLQSAIHPSSYQPKS